MSLKNILLDTDIGPDCDDVAAIAMLNIYKRAGLCNILGIGHCTSNPYGAGAIDAICNYYGNRDIPIGTYSGKNFLADENCMYYNKDLVATFDNRYQKTQPEDAVNFYRRILSEQPDQSVDFVAIGPLNNLSALIDSGPDAYSALTGIELVRRKVKRLVSMAGIFPCASLELRQRAKAIAICEIQEFKEFNVVCDIQAAQNVANNWPTPKTYLGFEAGLIETCGPLQKRFEDDHPVRMAYRLYTENGWRYSWDLLTVQYAIDDRSPNFRCSAQGTVRFGDSGTTIWSREEKGNDCFVEINQSLEAISYDINTLLLEN